MLDLTVVWAGPYTTMLLGDLGAEVIRVDNPCVLQRHPGRRRPGPSPAQLGRSAGWAPTPTTNPGARPWNRNAFFNCHARNKAGGHPRPRAGRWAGETFLRLVERADVLVENNSVDVLDKLGIGWDVLRARNPRLVVVRMPSLGLDGPYAALHRLRRQLRGAVRAHRAAGLPRHGPRPRRHSVYHMDAASGAAGACAALLALRRRAVTGRGELVELAQAENMLNHIGEF